MKGDELMVGVLRICGGILLGAVIGLGASGCCTDPVNGERYFCLGEISDAEEARMGAEYAPSFIAQSGGVYPDPALQTTLREIVIDKMAKRSQRPNLCLRVLGQALVVFFDATFLPPMEEWYSGLLPYPYLLVSQFIIIGVSAIVAMDFTRCAGRKKNHLRRDHDGPTEMLDRAGLVE